MTIDQELAALARMRDEDIDTSDIPEVTDWRGAVVGRFYRPIKQPVTVRVDADVLAWLKASGPGYQTRINVLLRAAMVGRMEVGEHHGDEAPGPGAFPTLEKQGQLERWTHLAVTVASRGSLFPLAA